MKRADHIGPPFFVLVRLNEWLRFAQSIHLAASIRHVALDPCCAGDLGYTASGFGVGIHAELLHASEFDLVTVHIFG